MANQENNANTFTFDEGTDDAQVKAGPGVVGRLAIHDVDSSASVILYDSLTATGSIIWQWVTADGKVSIDLDRRFTTGLFVAITGTTPEGWVTYK